MKFEREKKVPKEHTNTHDSKQVKPEQRTETIRPNKQTKDWAKPNNEWHETVRN